jgi:hypothetical protein
MKVKIGCDDIVPGISLHSIRVIPFEQFIGGRELLIIGHAGIMKFMPLNRCPTRA